MIINEHLSTNLLTHSQSNGIFNKNNFICTFCRKLSLTTGTWSDVEVEGSRSPSERYGHSVVTHDNKIYMYGGVMRSGHVSKVSPRREGIPGRHEPPPYRNESPLYRSEPPRLPYSTRASAIQNKFFKPLFYVLKKRCLEFCSTQWHNSFTEDYNYLIVVMNSAFNAT